jgi:hypothetical protein
VAAQLATQLNQQHERCHPPMLRRCCSFTPRRIVCRDRNEELLAASALYPVPLTFV